jgi:hypothetical protein
VAMVFHPFLILALSWVFHFYFTVLLLKAKESLATARCLSLEAKKKTVKRGVKE